MVKVKTLFLFLLLALPVGLLAQPATEVYLFDLKENQLLNPRNVSQNKGYDNQPFFSPDGTTLLYVSTVEGQTEVMAYALATTTKMQLTHTEGSEFSPTVMPDGRHFSAILLEKEGRQLLWKYPLQDGSPSILVPDLVIGYHAWLNAQRLYAFVLGDTSSLQEIDLAAATHTVLVTQIGRSLHRIPAQQAISFIDKNDSAAWMISRYDPATQKVTPIAPTLPGAEDMAWSPDGALWMGKGSILYRRYPAKEGEWQPVADLSQWGLKGITRLALHPDGNKIALVVEE